MTWRRATASIGHGDVTWHVVRQMGKDGWLGIR